MNAQTADRVARSRPVSELESRLLEALHRRDRATNRPRSHFSLGQDREWLEEEVGTRNLNQLVRRMTHKKSLFELKGGRYVVAPQGTTVLSQAAPFELALDAVLRRRTPYYLGYLSALQRHDLTDISERLAYVAVAAEKMAGSELIVAGRPVQPVRLSFEERWLGVEEIPLSGRVSYCRSNVERTLLDCLDRPKLCGGLEISVRAWERAVREERIDLDKLHSYALQLGGVWALRCAYWLYELGQAHRSDRLLEELSPRPRSGGLRLDPSQQFGSGGWPRDRRTGLQVNVPRELARGWISYGK